MDQFADRLGRLGELADGELSGLEQELVQAFDAADAAGDVDTMSQCADALDSVRAESQRRASAGSTQDAGATAPAAEAAPVAASGADSAVLDPPATEDEVTDPEPTAEVTAPSDEAPTEETTPEALAEGTEVAPEATDEAPAPADEAPTEDTATEDTASSQEEPSMDDAALTADVVPDDNVPDPESLRPPTTIRAGGDIPGVTAGSPLDTLDEVAEALTARINSIQHTTGGGGEQLIVATLTASIEDESRILRRGDAEGNAAKIRAALEPEALTAAANGWCAPRTPIYTQFGLGDADRPVRDSLTSFQADRGGIVYSTPAKLSDGTYGAGDWVWDSGSSSWKASSDPATAVGAGTTKVIYDAVCSAELTADLEALTSQIRFTNMIARAYPEWVRRNMELALIAHARFCENRLMYFMWAATDKVTADASINLGATRDVLVGLRSLCAYYRNKHRMARDAQMDVWAPGWLLDQCVLDLMLQQPGDNTLGAATAEVEGYIRESNVNVTWFRDTVPGYATSQYMGANGVFPANAAIVIAAPGTFLHLDGGTLDLGVVRDASLVGTNQYIEFSESLETLAKVGIEAFGWSPAVKIQGQTALPVTTAAGVTMS